MVDEYTVFPLRLTTVSGALVVLLAGPWTGAEATESRSRTDRDEIDSKRREMERWCGT